MWRKHIIAMVAASLALAATATGIAQETQLGVPRVADGTIDVQALVNGVDALVAQGVREIDFRDGTLTQDEAKSLVLRIQGNLLGDLATRLPNDGIPREITVSGPVDFSVQRLANGELSARIDDIFVGSPTEARRAEFTQQLAAQYGFDRLQIGGVDAAGNHILVEYVADRGIVRNEALAVQPDGGADHGDRHGKRRAEAQLSVPRSADGKTIDVTALLTGVENLIENGVRQIHFRHGALTQADAKSLILQTGGTLLGELATRLPSDGIQRQITLRGDVDVRVQRLANGELRARIDDIFVGSPTEARRAQFTEQLAAQYGFDRLTIRGVDAEGNRIRVEFRDGVIVRNEARAPHGDGGEKHADHRKDKKEHGGDHDKWAKRDSGGEHDADHRKDRSEHGAKWGERRDGGEDRADRRGNGREDRAVWREDRGDRGEKFMKIERQERTERSERREHRSERAERHAKFERPERPERAERAERPDRPERAERAERPERKDRH